jgi:hypothetical protein
MTLTIIIILSILLTTLCFYIIWILAGLTKENYKRITYFGIDKTITMLLIFIYVCFYMMIFILLCGINNTFLHFKY